MGHGSNHISYISPRQSVWTKDQTPGTARSCVKCPWTRCWYLWSSPVSTEGTGLTMHVKHINQCLAYNKVSKGNSYLPCTVPQLCKSFCVSSLFFLLTVVCINIVSFGAGTKSYTPTNLPPALIHSALQHMEEPNR